MISNIKNETFNYVTTKLNQCALNIKMREDINKMHTEIGILDRDIEYGYTQVGRQTIEKLVNGEKINIEDVEDIIERINLKIQRKKDLEVQIINNEKEIEQQRVIQEKNQIEKVFAKEKCKLDKALELKLINRAEYYSKLKKHRKNLAQNLKKLPNIY